MPTSKTKALARKLGLLKKSSSKNGGGESGCKRVKSSQTFSHILIIDFEATCWQERRNTQEIIEFPAVLLDMRSGDIVGEFHQYVQPQEDPRLSAFCKELTGISQDQVDGALPLPTCLMMFNRWVKELREVSGIILVEPGHKYSGEAKLCAMATWTDWDLGVCLRYECSRKHIRKPTYFEHWINLKMLYKVIFSQITTAMPAIMLLSLCTKYESSSFPSPIIKKFYERPPNGLAGALEDLGIKFIGRQHCGLDDARNTSRLCYRMAKDGCELCITKSIHVAPVCDIVRPPPSKVCGAAPAASADMDHHGDGGHGAGSVSMGPKHGVHQDMGSKSIQLNSCCGDNCHCGGPQPGHLVGGLDPSGLGLTGNSLTNRTSLPEQCAKKDDGRHVTMQPLSHVTVPSSHVTVQPLSHVTVPSSHVTVQPLSHVTVPSSHVTVQPLSHVTVPSSHVTVQPLSHVTVPSSHVTVQPLSHVTVPSSHVTVQPLSHVTVPSSHVTVQPLPPSSVYREEHAKGQCTLEEEDEKELDMLFGSIAKELDVHFDGRGGAVCGESSFKPTELCVGGAGVTPPDLVPQQQTSSCKPASASTVSSRLQSSSCIFGVKDRLDVHSCGRGQVIPSGDVLKELFSPCIDSVTPLSLATAAKQQPSCVSTPNRYSTTLVNTPTNNIHVRVIQESTYKCKTANQTPPLDGPSGILTKTATWTTPTIRTPTLVGLSGRGRPTPPLCKCGRRAKRQTVTTPGPNDGRHFFACPLGKACNSKGGCGFFKWADSPPAFVMVSPEILGSEYDDA